MTEPVFTVSRTFQAPLASVWAAWTQAEHLRRWWGPKGFTMEACTVDCRPGGLFHYGMRAPNGDAMWGRFVFREVEPMRRLVWVSSFSDARGHVARHTMAPQFPAEVLSELVLRETGGGTTIELVGRPVRATPEEVAFFTGLSASMSAGWAGTLDQLVEHLAGGAMDRSLVLERVFDAPIARVFECFTRQEHLDRWWGPRGFQTVTTSFEFREGGQWVYTLTGPDGTVYPNRHLYRRIQAPTYIGFWHDGGEGDPNGFESSLELEDLGGRTRVRLSNRFATAEVCRAGIAFGAIELGHSTLEKLDRLLSG